MGKTGTFAQIEESATCLNCGGRFSYTRHKGAPKKHCSDQCRERYGISRRTPKPYDHALRFRTCDVCSVEFSYPIGRGYDRRMCSDLCRKTKRNADCKTKPLCVTEGCGQPRGYSDGLCNACYCRRRRTGTLERRIYKHRTLATNGYVLLSGMHDHPLSKRGGLLTEHRKVLYDSIGPGPHPCHWCSKPIDWRVGSAGGIDALVPDHLDNNKTNNDLSNLVPSCNRCNWCRGMFMAWVHERKDDPVLWQMYLKAVERAA